MVSTHVAKAASIPTANLIKIPDIHKNYADSVSDRVNIIVDL